MMAAFQDYLGIHESALYLQSRRAEVLASNLANVDTPAYKARDIDFRQVLQAHDHADANTLMEISRAGHLQPDLESNEEGLLYRNPYQASVDGNTVEHQVELAAYSDNAMRYLASLRILSGKMNTLNTAIRGQ
jgi:flagellar basal-body rod protein FlgB